MAASLLSRMVKASVKWSLMFFRPFAFGNKGINLLLLNFIPASNKVGRSTINEQELKGEFYEPVKKKHPETVILYFHGGGYCGGSPRSHRALVSHLSEYTGITAFNCAYRLAPENPFPAALEDALKAYNYLADKYNRIILAGDSAGGGLCLALMIRLIQLDRPQQDPCYLLAPWVDLDMRQQQLDEVVKRDPMLRPDALENYAHLYAQNNDLNNPLISPAKASEEILEQLPPILFQVGTDDILNPQVVSFQKKLSQSEIKIWKDMMHVWQAAAFLPEAKSAFREAALWLDQKLQA
jgi:acetyl esterase/lipase